MCSLIYRKSEREEVEEVVVNHMAVSTVVEQPKEQILDLEPEEQARKRRARSTNCYNFFKLKPP